MQTSSSENLSAAAALDDSRRVKPGMLLAVAGKTLNQATMVILDVLGRDRNGYLVEVVSSTIGRHRRAVSQADYVRWPWEPDDSHHWCRASLPVVEQESTDLLGAKVGDVWKNASGHRTTLTKIDYADEKWPFLWESDLASGLAYWTDRFGVTTPNNLNVVTFLARPGY